MAMVMTACTAEKIGDPDKKAGTVLTAGIVETKTVLENDTVVKWTDGDKICVNGNESSALKLDAASATATFVFEAVMQPAYSAVFPASIYKDAQTVTLPAVQKFKAGSFDASAAPMAAYSASGSKLQFSHLCSVVKLIINKSESDDCKISYIEFSGKNNERISGDFEIDYINKNLALGSAADDADKKVRYEVAQAQSADNALVAYIAVPAHTYSNGFSIKIVDRYGHFMVKEASARSLQAGCVHEMPEFTFVPTGTEFGVEIKSAADLIAFAKAYDNNEYTSTDENPLIVSLANSIEFTDEENGKFVSIGDRGENKFRGIFYGNGNTISNFNSGNALFDGLNDEGRVENLTISGNATVDVSSTNNYFSAFVNYNRGTISYCTSNVNFTVNGGAANVDILIGGVAARNVAGTVSHCVSNSNIKMQCAYTASESKTIWAGGIVGWISNQDGIVEESEYQGQLYYYENPQKNIIRVGGVCGENYGTIRKSQSKKVAQLNDAFAIDGNKATIIVGTKIADASIGGIAGVSQGIITECNSYVDICGISEEYATENLGGIVGVNTGEVSKSTNHEGATLNGISSYAKNRLVGGIVGKNHGNGAISECFNYAELSVNPGKYTQFGGVVGNNQAKLSASGNYGKITLIQNTTRINCDIKVGGVVGENAYNISASQEARLFNDGNITFAAPSGGFSGGFKVGGAFGSSNNDVSGLENSGNITGDKVQYVGGVVGYSDKSVKNCTNSGNISVGSGTENLIVGNNENHDSSNTNAGTIL